MSILQLTRSWMVASALALICSSVVVAQELRETPRFVPLDLEAAERLASEAGIGLVIDRREAPRRIGEVVDQIPEAGAMLGADRRVWIQVSAGRTVPDLTGLSRADAEARLSELGITLEVVERPFPNVPDGHVVDMIPLPGTRIDPTTQVVVLVVPASMLEVPFGLVGQGHQQAEGRLREIGLVVTFDRQIRPEERGPTNCNFPCGRSTVYGYTVLGLSPPAGEIVPRGSSVRLELREDRVDHPDPCNQYCVIH